MDQLVQMMHQRSFDILILQKSRFQNFSELLIREKDRSQKQNWVLKILKSIKMLTPQLKSDIFYKSQEMMNIYENIPFQHKENLDDHFTQKVINLFIDFFNLVADKIPQNNSIKAFVRPNNAFIITDLIKCLIDLQRKKFRDLYVIASSLDGEGRQKTKRIVGDVLTEGELNFAQLKEIQLIEKNRNLKQNKLNNPQELLQKALKEKFMNFIKMIDIKELENRINLNFLELKQKNQKNGYFMEKFRQKCLGKRSAKCTNYDLAGLYTKQQLKKIEQKLQAKVQSDKPTQEPDLRETQCLSEHESRPNEAFSSLKQDALNEFQKMQNLSIYQKNTSRKSSTIQKWLPLSLIKKLSKQNPWQIYIINNKHKVKSSEIIEDPEISSMGVKEFLLMKMNQVFRVQENKVYKEETEQKFFDKRVFLDFGRRKEFQLVEGDKIILRRELFFPVLKENEEKEQFSERNNNKQQQLSIRRKSKSETKFLPRFAKLNSNDKSTIEQHTNASLVEKYPLLPQNYLQTIAKSPDFKPLALKKSPISLKIRKNSMEEILNEKILQRKLQIEEENVRYQNRMKLLFGTDNQRNVIRAKNKKHKTSLMGISVPFGNEHFLQ